MRGASPHRSLWAWALVLALVWLSAWGSVHRVLHLGGPSVAVSAVMHKAATAGLAHEDGSSLCQLLDHLGHASGLPVALALVLPEALPMRLVSAHAAQAFFSASQAFQARAPPATSRA